MKRMLEVFVVNWDIIREWKKERNYLLEKERIGF